MQNYLILINYMEAICGLVTHLNKKPSKLLDVLWWKWQAGNIHVSKNKINNSSKNINLLVDRFILKYIYIYYIYIHTHTHTQTHTYVCLHIYAHIHTYTHTHTHTHMYIHKHTHNFPSTILPTVTQGFTQGIKWSEWFGRQGIFFHPLHKSLSHNVNNCEFRS